MKTKVPIKIKSNIKPSALPKKHDLEEGMPDQPFWNIKHYTFLQIYRESLDEKEAAKSAGLDANELKKILADKKIRIAMEDAKDDFIESLNLTPKKGAKKFLEVYKKIEQRFDEGENNVAGPLANMAATFLKATGQLGGREDKVIPKVSININLNSNKSTKKANVIEDSVDVNLINSSMYE
jgi:hypothetical protein